MDQQLDWDRPGRWSEFLTEMTSRWRREKQTDAERLIDRFPQIARRRTLVMDLAYEEYCLRRDWAESVNASDYCGRFPTVRHSLAKLLDVHEHISFSTAEIDADQPKYDVGDVLFDRFVVLESIGKGAFGQVYLCREPNVGERQVVLKVARRGQFEAKRLGRLTHPNTIPILDWYGEEGETQSGILMPFRGRGTFDDLLDHAWPRTRSSSDAECLFRAATERCKPTDLYDRSTQDDGPPSGVTFTEMVAWLGAELADGLGNAHSREVVHGDLKPSNILLTPKGKPLLLDFNLSLDINQESRITGGTLPYMSPEKIKCVVLHQPDARFEIGPHSDLYSLGAILYQLLTGRLPYSVDLSASSSRDGLAKRLLDSQAEAPAAPSFYNGEVGRDLDGIVLECLRYSPDKRPASADVVGQQLRRCYEITNPLKWAWRKHPRLVKQFASGLCILIGGTAVLATQLDSSAERAYGRALGLAAAGDFEAAGTHFARAAPLLLDAGHPDSREKAFDAYYWLGRSMLALEDYDDAARAFEHCLKLRDDPEVYAQRGVALKFSVRREEAYQSFMTAVARGFESAGVYTNIGGFDFIQGRMDQAIDCYSKALQLEPDHVNARFGRLLALQMKIRNDRELFPMMAIEDIGVLLSGQHQDYYLYLTAAEVYSMMSVHDPQYVDLALDALAESVCIGCDPVANLFRARSDLMPINKHPRFVEISNRKPQFEPQRLLYFNDKTITPCREL